MIKRVLLQRCPRCGKGKLFSGLLKVVEHCSECGLSLHEHEVGDGPAFLVITVLGFVVTVSAVAVELLYAPPFWVHAVLWVPLTLIGTPYLLRLSKSAIIAWQYNSQLLHQKHD